jgi:hypothetical protein
MSQNLLPKKVSEGLVHWCECGHYYLKELGLQTWAWPGCSPLTSYNTSWILFPQQVCERREEMHQKECITLACLVCAIDWRWKIGRGSLFVTRACVYCELLTNQITLKGCKTTLSQICGECHKEFATQMCISNALIHWRKCSHLLDKIRVTDVTSFLSLLTTQASWNKCNTLHHACLLAVCDWRWKKWWGMEGVLFVTRACVFVSYEQIRPQ